MTSTAPQVLIDNKQYCWLPFVEKSHFPPSSLWSTVSCSPVFLLDNLQEAREAFVDLIRGPTNCLVGGFNPSEKY